MNSIGVMQGRLSPPVNGRIQAFPWSAWREEFPKAERCGLDCIEWILEGGNWNENPFFANSEELLNLSEKHHVKLLSVCADYFMDCPLIRSSREQQEDRLKMLRRLIRQAAGMGIRYIEIPFVDNSAIRTPDEVKEVVCCLRRCLDDAERLGVQLALETSLDPSGFAELIQTLVYPSAKINYDIGNSACLGYDTRQEIQTYGQWIATVHIKDRVRSGGTVPLGTGDADFDATFSALAEASFRGPFILQAARIANLDETDAIQKYTVFLHDHLRKYFASPAPS